MEFLFYVDTYSNTSITQLEIFNRKEEMGEKKGRETPWVTRRYINLWVL